MLPRCSRARLAPRPRKGATMPTNPRTPVLALLRPHRRRLLAAAVVTLAASGLALVQPAVLQSLVDTAGTHAPPLTLVGVLALAVVAESLCRGAAVYHVMSASESVTLDLRATLAQHALRLPLRRLETTRRGDLVARAVTMCERDERPRHDGRRRDSCRAATVECGRRSRQRQGRGGGPGAERRAPSGHVPRAPVHPHSCCPPHGRHRDTAHTSSGERLWSRRWWDVPVRVPP